MKLQKYFETVLKTAAKRGNKQHRGITILYNLRCK